MGEKSVIILFLVLGNFDSADFRIVLQVPD